MKLEFDIKIPDLPETDDFDMDQYAGEIVRAVEKMPRWKIQVDTIVPK